MLPLKNAVYADLVENTPDSVAVQTWWSSIVGWSSHSAARSQMSRYSAMAGTVGAPRMSLTHALPAKAYATVRRFKMRVGTMVMR
uniref:Uncharacterized protein n=1 Tax=Arundo donax TaxID=35708 RepID=A0A0A8ZV78_ARUDO